MRSLRSAHRVSNSMSSVNGRDTIPFLSHPPTWLGSVIRVEAVPHRDLSSRSQAFVV
jgi:hypothetical protein